VNVKIARAPARVGKELHMPWDLALPLLVCLVTGLLFVGIYFSAKKLLTDPRRAEQSK